MQKKKIHNGSQIEPKHWLTPSDNIITINLSVIKHATSRFRDEIEPPTFMEQKVRECCTHASKSITQKRLLIHKHNLPTVIAN
jgi:hypothetical protein